MLPLEHPDRIKIAFDDHRLVNNAGLLLPATLAQHVGLRELVDRHLDLGGAPGVHQHHLEAPFFQHPNSGIQYTPVDSMTTVSTPHSVNQSARRYRSAVKASNSRTGCSARSAGTATKWLVAPRQCPPRSGSAGTALPVLRCSGVCSSSPLPLPCRRVAGGSRGLCHSPQRDRPDRGRHQ